MSIYCIAMVVDFSVIVAIVKFDHSMLLIIGNRFFAVNLDKWLILTASILQYLHEVDFKFDNHWVFQFESLFGDMVWSF